jgi:alpha-glucosidase
LYNLFIAQEEVGDPILRPLAYEFPKADMNINDAFLVGASILQAPIVDEKLRSRTVPLPVGSWMDANTGDWFHGDHTHAKPGRAETPLYLRNGAIVPTAPGTPTTNKNNLRDIEVMICIDPSTAGKATYTYHADDGETYAYQKGKRSTLRVEAEWDKKELRLNVNQTSHGFGVIKWKPVIFSGPAKVTINGVLTKTKEAKRKLTGGPLPCRVVG